MAMTRNEFFRAQTLELEALKDRVRNFIKAKHWQSDGEWKESVLRTVLRRHLPAHLQPLRGFVTDGEAWTGQIDILLYDSTRPVLFRDGDLVFVTPDAVAGVIEVKSTIPTLGKLKASLRSLVKNIQLIRRSGQLSVFAGLFAYETGLNASHMPNILSSIAQSSANDATRVVDMVSLGAVSSSCIGKDLAPTRTPILYLADGTDTISRIQPPVILSTMSSI